MIADEDADDRPWISDARRRRDRQDADMMTGRLAYRAGVSADDAASKYANKNRRRFVRKGWFAEEAEAAGRRYPSGY